jgi:hypothetical protein
MATNQNNLEINLLSASKIESSQVDDDMEFINIKPDLNVSVSSKDTLEMLGLINDARVGYDPW